jgi:single-strand DNA-binding protein
MALPLISGEFRLAADPELRFSPAGMAVSNVRLVASSRKLNKETDKWEDDKTCWIDGVVFKDHAEHVAESLRKGDLVVVTGHIQTDEWEKDGEKRSKIAMVIDAIGPALRFRDVPRGQDAERTQGGAATPAAEDPWATPPADGAPPF